MRWQIRAICGGCDKVGDWNVDSLPAVLTERAQCEYGEIIKINCISGDCSQEPHHHHVRAIPYGCLAVYGEEYLEPNDTGQRRALKYPLNTSNLHVKNMHIKVQLSPDILRELRGLGR